ncbi:hypothetical protein B0H67DRAFT_660556 [Lasiosphaeris hirsuta]|uniref:Uncharacterized protein n=1 Tax=Lasiosphaeris hirsuta TaxID=260670 RepID=A0AA40ANR4_9PEZI|nr:hypothetical protein B0H67DRAFT_660556 [Lasiosphaeris hirsuta]
MRQQDVLATYIGPNHTATPLTLYEIGHTLSHTDPIYRHLRWAQEYPFLVPNMARFGVDPTFSLPMNALAYETAPLQPGQVDMHKRLRCALLHEADYDCLDSVAFAALRYCPHCYTDYAINIVPDVAPAMHKINAKEIQHRVASRQNIFGFVHLFASSFPNLPSRHPTGSHHTTILTSIAKVVAITLGIPITLTTAYLLYLHRKVSPHVITETNHHQSPSDKTLANVRKPTCMPLDVAKDDSKWILAYERVASRPIPLSHLETSPLSAVLTRYIRATMTAFGNTPQVFLLRRMMPRDDAVTAETFSQ